MLAIQVMSANNWVNRWWRKKEGVDIRWSNLLQQQSVIEPPAWPHMTDLMMLSDFILTFAIVVGNRRLLFSRFEAGSVT